MNKKIVKILTTTIAFFMLLFIINNFALAVDSKFVTEQFDGMTRTSEKGIDMITDIIGMVLSAVRIIATGVAIIMITVLGIKYMSAAPSEKANIKNQLITFTIGAVIVVATTSLLDIIKGFADTAFSS